MRPISSMFKVRLVLDFFWHFGNIEVEVLALSPKRKKIEE
jgi:hypothetical protein